jgi:nicotinate-nucleotide pyrophosphorylase (carboxylating)
LQHLSGIATLTGQYVERVVGTHARILDTRKTLPGLRGLQKYAVQTGGGTNHRLRLDDGVLIKDNHISVCGSITEAVKRARAGAPFLTRIEVECDTLEQVQEAIQAKADVIMLDNMTTAQLREAVEMVNGQALLEASGNVSLETVRDIAETGVDFISVGKLTHSAPSADIGLDIVMK